MRKLFYNGDILTMSSPRPAEAVLVEGARILAVGDLSAIAALAGRQVEIVDLCGGALIPGMIGGGGDFWGAVREEAACRGGVHPRTLRAAARTVACRYAARGWTVCVGQDMTGERLRLLQHSALPLPLMAIADIRDYENAKRAAAGTRGAVRLCGLSLDLDVREDGGEATGCLAYCDRALGFALRMAAAEGVTPVVRAESAEAAEQLLRVARAMSRVCPALLTARPVLLDARRLAPTRMEQVRQLGIVPAFSADVIPRLGDDYLSAWGMERAARLTPFAAARGAGVPYTLCASAVRAGEIPDPIELLSAAVERRTARGVTLGGCERATVYEALRALTSGGAWQYHLERERGTIRAGARADLTWLDRSPLAVPTRSLRELRVVATIASGEVLWQARQHEISTHDMRVPSVY